MKPLLAVIAVCLVMLVLLQFREQFDRYADRSAAETEQVDKALRQNGHLD